MSGATRAICFAIAALFAGPALATDELELGFGVSALHIDDYPGAEQGRSALLPFPYVEMHTARIDLERDRVRGLLWSSGRFALHLGLSGALPVDSDRNHARHGMPDLDAVGEIGPQIAFRLGDAGHATQYRLELITRSAWRIGDGGIGEEGWWASPRFAFDVYRKSAAGRFSFEGHVGAVFGTEDYHAYYYEVDPAYATLDRPAYRASAGFGGYKASLGIGVRRGAWWWGGFVRYFDLSDAAFADSPLVKRPSSVNAGLGLAYVMTRPPRSAPVGAVSASLSSMRRADPVTNQD